MIEVTSIDLRGLEFMLNGLRHAMIGTGKDGDLSKLVADETRLLSMEISKQVSPKTTAAGKRNVERDVGHFLAAREDTSEIFEGHGDMRWISAGPRFLTGIDPDDDYRHSDSAAALTLLQSERQGERGARYIDLGVRGHQQVRRLNRPVVSPSTKASLLQTLYARIGRLKASWAEAAFKHGQKNIPSWIKKHFPTPKSIMHDGLSNSEAPYIEFGSSAPGVKKFENQIRRAVRNREAKLRIRIKQTLFGYSQDAKHGAIHRHVKKESHGTS